MSKCKVVYRVYGECEETVDEWTVGVYVDEDEATAKVEEMTEKSNLPKDNLYLLEEHFFTEEVQLYE